MEPTPTLMGMAQVVPRALDADLDIELVARLRMAIARLGRQLRQQAGELSPTLQSMLASIANHGPLSLSELAAVEQIAPPTVTKVLAKLDERGLIVRERGAVDRRVTLVSLSDEGRARFEESRTRRTAWLVGRLAELGIDTGERLVETVELLEALAQPGHDPSRPGGRGSAS